MLTHSRITIVGETGVVRTRLQLWSSHGGRRGVENLNRCLAQNMGKRVVEEDG